MGLASLPDAREAFLDDLLRIRTTETKRAEEAEALNVLAVALATECTYAAVVNKDRLRSLAEEAREFLVRRSGEDDEG
jgi:plasmid stability protein